MDSLDCCTYNFSRLHTNVKFKAIFKINIVKILIIYIVIDFNGNHCNFFGWFLKRLWIRNGHLKWQHFVCHIEKMKILNSKEFQSSIKKNLNKIKHHQMKNLLVKCIKSYIYITSFKWHYCCKFLSLKVQFTLFF